MARKKNDLIDEEMRDSLSKDEALISSLQKKWNSWLGELERYHIGRFDENYRQYTAYSDTSGTDSKISDPLASELVERVIQRLFGADPKFIAFSRGRDIPHEIACVISNTAAYLWSNPDTLRTSGTSRSKMKVTGREFCVTGNCAVETFYNHDASNPDFRPVPIEDVIFNPAKTLKTSGEYFVRQYVSLEELEKLKEIKEEGKTVGGLFKNLDVLRAKLENKSSVDKENSRIHRSGRTEGQDYKEEILLISYWKGKKLIQIADWEVIIREAEDPRLLGEDPLDFAMDIELPKEPYGMSILDSINGLTAAKDLILNQVLDYGAKALNPPLFVDPNLPMPNRQTLRNAYKLGGVVFANVQQAAHQPMPQLPSVGFDLMTYIQQRAESSSGIGSYLGGVPNQESDSTRGTASGIRMLLQQAQPPIKDRQRNIEESVIEPVVNKMLKMAGELMSEDEIKYVLVSGQDGKWLRVTKGLLTGKITLKDLVISELISEEDAAAIAEEMIAEGKDPEKDAKFDVDWVVRVETGSMAEVDIEQEFNTTAQLLTMATEFGVPVDATKMWLEAAYSLGKKEPQQFLAEQQQQQGASPQDVQAQAQAKMMEQEMQFRAEKHQVEMGQEKYKTEQARLKTVTEKGKAFNTITKPIQDEQRRAQQSAERI